MTLTDHLQRIMIRIYLRYVSAIFCGIAWLAVKFHKPPSSTGKELLILKPDAIGDYILLRNFLTLLRESEAYRDYRITFCGNAACRDLAEKYDQGVVDEFIWIPKSRIYLNPFRFAALVRRMHYRYAVTLHAVRSRELLFDFLARYSSPFDRIAPEGDTVNILPLYKKLSDRWYTRLIPSGDAFTFEFDANRTFVEQLIGRPIAMAAPHLGERRDRVVPPAELPERYAVVFPGAQLPFRRWDPVNFAVVCRHLRERYGLEIVLMGAGPDQRLTERIRHSLPFPVTDLSGKTRLAEIPSVISRAQLLLANDSMAVHMAAALGVPAVVVSQMNHYGRFVPYPPGAGATMACVIPEPFLHTDPLELAWRYRYGSGVEVRLVTIAQVIRAIDMVMKEKGGFA